MSEYLIVRLSNNHQLEKQWLVWSESQKEVIASGAVPADQELSVIADYAKQRQTIVLLSAADVLFKQVTVPAGGARQFETMLPYLVEDDVAQDVEQLHFTVLAKQGAQANVCAVDKQWLSQQLAQLSEFGFNVRKVLPDALALPDSEGISAVELAGQWLLKKQQYQAVSVESAWLPMMAQSDWVKEDEQWLPLQAFSSLPSLALNEQQEWQQAEPQLVMQMLATQAIASKVNLLTGEFKPKSTVTKHLKIWRKAAIAAVVLLVVLITQNMLHTHQAEAQAAAYRAESERIFRAVSGKKKIPTVSYLKRELEREVTRLSGGRSGDTVLDWLVKLPEAFKAAPDSKLLGFKFDSQRDVVSLEVTSKDFQTFEKMRSTLEQEFTVKQGQLNKQDGLVFGSLELSKK
ncbi:type II secretion system protein GspL [Vibrio sp. LaRot3]|uniref:type II secretion system protein GspL n=1 Tax=Vibrio sp. LaRot3 TaxID=2998829 RepID=UPI0022CE2579|nr:type II secretion system protein GspL [Vibrio sp. LaRot3]MDA0149342.1 type II secretion system protein GspL [Vibrio sp. LaRot3]